MKTRTVAVRAKPPISDPAERLELTPAAERLLRPKGRVNRLSDTVTMVSDGRGVHVLIEDGEQMAETILRLLTGETGGVPCVG